VRIEHATWDAAARPVAPGFSCAYIAGYRKYWPVSRSSLIAVSPSWPSLPLGKMPIMATKIGRNDPCRCGSGKKYKRCCLEQNQQDERDARERLAAALAAEQAEDEELEAWSDALDAASEAVLDLLEASQLDQAEVAAHELIESFPEVHDGYDLLGMVYEAREEPKKAADCYRRVIEFMQADPSDYDAELTSLQALIEELDPSDPTDKAT
jgi:tetratricopeptide (TPR) repeat protein